MAESASASIATTTLSSGSYAYSITLTDTGTTPIGTFWFAWVPGQGYLPDVPSFSAPTGWTAIQTDGTPPNNGYSILYQAGTGAALAPGGSLGGFDFTSATTPAALFGTSTIHPPTPVATSVVFSGAPFSDSGFTFDAACFAAGTHILTEQGARPIEALEVGCRVVTGSGRLGTVRWVGNRRVDCAAHPRPADVFPVHVSAGAFGPGMPHRDLFLSRDHAVFADGCLIPVRHLVNGTTIAPVPRAEIVYWHLELDHHDLVLAEGLACESYRDTGNRAAFEDSDETADRMML